MNDHFTRLMRAATHATTQGDLAAATRTIQQALAGHSATVDIPPDAANPDSTVIDIPFREVATPQSGEEDASQFNTAQNEQALVRRGVHQAKSGSRKYRLFVPTPDVSQQLPLVVMLHGCTQHADDFALGTEMDEIADHHGVMVLYPEQSRQGNANGCWNWFRQQDHRRDHGECGILADMVLSLAREFDADTTRIFVAGLSAGGAMAAVLCHQHPEIFRAVGVHSGLPAGQAKDLPSALSLMSRGKTGPTRAGSLSALPTIVFHGTADQTVNPSNGKHVFDTAVAGSSNGMPPIRAETGQSAGREYTRTVCLNDTGQPLHEHWAVHGAGHAWSGGNPDGSFTDRSGPKASSEMMRFFLSQK